MQPVSTPARSSAPIRTTAGLMLAIALAGTAAAQVPPVFFTAGVSRANVPEVVVFGPCTVAVAICTRTHSVPNGAAGGMAWDPVNLVFWHTNGSTLEAIFEPAHSCDQTCETASPVQDASGLAFDVSTSSLWILGLAPELVRTSVPRGGLCPQVQSRCSLAGVVPAGTVAAGLAVSEKRGLLFYSASAGGSPPVNLILVAPMSDPCRPICRIDLGPAFGPAQTDPITGLGYDDCDDELFAAAGSSGIVRARLAFPGCSVLASSRCVPPGGHRFHGLCLAPPHPAVIGRSCVSPPCPSCSSTRMRANDATLGNAGFALSIFSAPAPALAIPLMGIGPCGAGHPPCVASSTQRSLRSSSCRPSPCRARRSAPGPRPCRSPFLPTERCAGRTCACRR